MERRTNGIRRTSPYDRATCGTGWPIRQARFSARASCSYSGGWSKKPPNRTTDSGLCGARLWIGQDGRFVSLLSSRVLYNRVVVLATAFTLCRNLAYSCPIFREFLLHSPPPGRTICREQTRAQGRESLAADQRRGTSAKEA